jgi:hypothetical protein
MKHNSGDEKLIPMLEWGVPADIQGSDEIVLNSPIMIKAQEKIIELFKPKSNTAFVSLCTSTRPYSSGRKWNKFIKEFNDVDFIISSNGGVIPIEYENSYPYLTYDAHGTIEYDEVYKLYTTRNLIRFFILKKYENIVFNFRPNLRNSKSAKIAGDYLFEKGHIKSYCIIPNIDLYNEAQNDGFTKLGLSMYPDLHPIILTKLKESVIKYTKNTTIKKEKDENDINLFW